MYIYRCACAGHEKDIERRGRTLTGDGKSGGNGIHVIRKQKGDQLGEGREPAGGWRKMDMGGQWFPSRVGFDFPKSLVRKQHC